MGSLFSRPHATALFTINGVSKGLQNLSIICLILSIVLILNLTGSFDSLSEKKFAVDQV